MSLASEKHSAHFLEHVTRGLRGLLADGAARRRFQLATPFPHIVADGLVPEALLHEVEREFPDRPSTACRSMAMRGWKCTMHDKATRKLSLADENRMGKALQGVMRALKSDEFIAHVQNLTGIGPLRASPVNFGAGLHQIFPNGSLQVHADDNHMHNRHPANLVLNETTCPGCWERRVNLFLYLNRDWDARWGGDLQLWNSDLTECGARLAPLHNRLVVFASTDYSFHGHPEPLGCPEGRTRRAIAIYYYTSGGAGARPLAELNLTARGRRMSTLYRRRACPSCALEKCRVSGTELV